MTIADRPDFARGRPPALAALFGTCLKIGMLSFGGGLTGWLHREFVGRHGWIPDDDFNSTLALAQIMPGANVVNLVVCLGEQLRGPLGAAVCVLGFLLPPIASVLALAALLDQFGDAPLLEIAMAGISFAALGMLIQVAWRGIARARSAPPRLVIIAATAILVVGLGLPVIAAVVLIAPISVWLAWRQL